MLTFSGDNANATNDCENDSYSQVWEAFSTDVQLNIAIVNCGTTPYTDDESPGYRTSRINSFIFSDCPCGERHGRDSYDITTCPDGMLTNYFNYLPAGNYYIPVRYRSPQARGPYAIHVTATAVPPPPASDECVNAQAIGDTTNVPFNTSTASLDGSDECISSCNIWYLYTASATGQVNANLCGSSFDTKLAIYDRADCSNLTLIGCNDDSCEVGSIVLFDAVQGNQYLIDVGGSGPSYGEGLLTIRPTIPTCEYTPGDINNNGSTNGVDIVYAVNFFKGGPNPPPIDCYPIFPLTPNPLFAAGDVNGNCAFNGIDITYFVRFLKLQVPNLLTCPNCLPILLAPHSPTVEPMQAPILKNNIGNSSHKTD